MGKQKGRLAGNPVVSGRREEVGYEILVLREDSLFIATPGQGKTPL